MTRSPANESPSRTGCIYLFRKNTVFTTLHLKSSIYVVLPLLIPLNSLLKRWPQPTVRNFNDDIVSLFYLFFILYLFSSDKLKFLSCFLLLNYRELSLLLTRKQQHTENVCLFFILKLINSSCIILVL